MTETTNVEIARRGFEAAMRGDLDAIRELLDPEIKWHGGNPSEPGSCHNGEEALAFMRAARSARGAKPSAISWTSSAPATRSW
jgi:ketosteroid isomerase-like protein